MSDLGCSPNAAAAFDFLVGKGLSDFQAAAVVGNLQHESGLAPLLDVYLSLPGKPREHARGIASWGPQRWDRLVEFAAQAGSDPRSLGTQLDFLWYELPSHGLEQLRSATTLEAAVVVFQDLYERPAKEYAHTDSRIAYARAALFACPTLKPPKRGIWAAALGALALAAGAGFSVYTALAYRRPAARPAPKPPILPPHRPRPVPDFDYRSRL